MFLAVLVLYLPASWFAARLPPGVHCNELGGSVWHGECLGLTFDGGKYGDASWNLSPLRALAGRLEGDVDVRGAALTARADLDMGFDGAGVLTAVTAQFPMDPAFVRQFPRDQRGLIVAQFARLALDAGGLPRELDGSVELRDFRQLSPRPLELGSYRVVFKDNVGKLDDIGGPFGVDGKVTFTPPNNYVVEGLISGRTPAAQGIVREITLNAPPDASGRNEFRFENSF
ncbi:MAG TPA: type II secretion system protein N [Steroidobacteraceae bacterium]|nr:type II secretion system protein N [Steroidobacteraceae bacterium]